MGWVIRALTGPTLWAVLFSAVYAAHGLGCGWGWAGRPGFLGMDLHQGAMVAVWLAGLALHALSLTLVLPGTTRQARIVRAGLWTGLVASVFTLFPVLFATTCG